MSDFLSHLTARSFGSAPSFRPRVASLFEAPASSPASLTGRLEARREVDAAFAENAAREDTDSEAGDQRTTRRPRKSLEAQRPVYDRQTHATEDMQVDAAVAPVRRSTQERDKPSSPTLVNTHPIRTQIDADLGTVRTDKPAQLDSASEPSLQTEGLKIAQLPQAVDQRLEQPTTAQVRKASQLLVEEHSAASLRPRAERSKDSLGNSLRERMALADAPRPEAHGTLTARPTLVTNATSAAIPRERKSVADAMPSAAPEQTIHVTIGRIDVRAELPTPATRRADPKQSTGITLEDYLRRKTAGSSL